jgi:hypothetical protein
LDEKNNVKIYVVRIYHIYAPEVEFISNATAIIKIARLIFIKVVDLGLMTSLLIVF